MNIICVIYINLILNLMQEIMLTVYFLLRIKTNLVSCKIKLQEPKVIYHVTLIAMLQLARKNIQNLVQTLAFCTQISYRELRNL